MASMKSCQSCYSRRQGCSLTGKPFDEQARCARCTERGLECRQRDPTAASKGARTVGTPRGPSPPLHDDTNQRKVYLSIDLGTSRMKIAFKVVKPGQKSDPRDVKSIREIRFNNNANFCPSVIAIDESEIWNNNCVIYGDQVFRHLESRRLSTDTCFLNLKAIVLNPELPEAKETQDRLRKLHPGTVAYLRSRLQPDICSVGDLTPLELYSVLLGCVFEYVLRRIADQNAMRSLKQWLDDDGLRKKTKPSNPISVIMPLPEQTTADQRNLIGKAAQGAGIFNPSFIGEPTGGVIYHLAVEQDTPINKILLIEDHGAGTVDIAVWKVSSTNPLQSTKFYQIGPNDTPSLLATLKVNNNPMTEDQFMTELGAKLELAISGFNSNPVSTQQIFMPGLPQKPAWNMRHPNCITITPDMFKRAYEPTIKRLLEVKSEQFTQLGVNQLSSQRTPEHVHINLLFGGAIAANDGHDSYIKTKYSEAYPGHVFSTSYSATDIAVAKGSLLYLLNRDIINERIVLRGFGVVQRVPTDRARYGRNVPRNLEQSMLDGQWRLSDMMKFLITPGQRVKRHHVSRVRGIIPLGENAHDFNPLRGWPIIQKLYYSDTQTKNDIHATEENGIFPMENPLEFWVSEVLIRQLGLGVNIQEARRNGKLERWVETEYEIRLVLDDDEMSFECVIPKGGTFVGALDAELSESEDGYVQRGTYNIAGQFELSPTAGACGLRQRSSDKVVLLSTKLSIKIWEARYSQFGRDCGIIRSIQTPSSEAEDLQK